MAGNQYSHSPDMVHGGETTEKAQPQARASRQKLFKILAIAFGAAAAVALSKATSPLSPFTKVSQLTNLPSHQFISTFRP